MSRKPQWILAGVTLACMMLAGCGHGAGYRKPYRDTPQTGLGTPPAGSAQTRGPGSSSTGLAPLGSTGASSFTGSQGSSVTPAGLANPGTTSGSAGKPLSPSGSSAFKSYEQAPLVPPRQTVATSTAMEKPAAATIAPETNGLGQKIPILPGSEKTAADPKLRQTLPPFREETSGPPAPTAPQAPPPIPDQPASGK